MFVPLGPNGNNAVTHICVSNLIITGSGNGLSPGRRQAIIWTNDGILLIGPLRTNFSETWIEILTVSFKKMRLKVSSAKSGPFNLGLNVLTTFQWVVRTWHVQSPLSMAMALWYNKVLIYFANRVMNPGLLSSLCSYVLWSWWHGINSWQQKYRVSQPTNAFNRSWKTISIQTDIKAVWLCDANDIFDASGHGDYIAPKNLHQRRFFVSFASDVEYDDLNITFFKWLLWSYVSSYIKLIESITSARYMWGVIVHSYPNFNGDLAKPPLKLHYGDVIMSTMASQITSACKWYNSKVKLVFVMNNQCTDLSNHQTILLFFVKITAPVLSNRNTCIWNLWSIFCQFDIF